MGCVSDAGVRPRELDAEVDFETMHWHSHALVQVQWASYRQAHRMTEPTPMLSALELAITNNSAGPTESITWLTMTTLALRSTFHERPDLKMSHGSKPRGATSKQRLVSEVLSPPYRLGQPTLRHILHSERALPRV